MLFISKFKTMMYDKRYRSEFYCNNKTFYIWSSDYYCINRKINFSKLFTIDETLTYSVKI